MNTFEFEVRTDGSIQVRLVTNLGLIDLIFAGKEQFLEFVAGQLHNL